MSRAQGSRLLNGRKVVTTAGTRVRITTTPTSIVSICVTALSTNTGIIVLGGNTVVAAAGTRAGTPLQANESVTYNLGDLAEIYLDSTVDGEGISYSAEAPIAQ
jgi:hypothetical protein